MQKQLRSFSLTKYCYSSFRITRYHMFITLRLTMNVKSFCNNQRIITTNNIAMHEDTLMQHCQKG